MKLTLHIGTEKTGTTALQRWLAANRESLLEQGVWYPRSLGRDSHRELAVMARDPDKPDDGARQRNLRTAADHAAFSAKLRAQFDDECSRQATLRHCVISSEHLHSRLTSAAMVQRVRDFLGDRFESVEVLVHLRPQIDLAVSLASTACRMGHAVDPRRFEGVAADEPYYDYDALVQRWEATFGADRVRIVAFRRQPSIHQVLIDRVAIDAARLAPLERVNEALDWRSVAIVNALIAAAGPAVDRDYLRALGIDEWPVQERLKVDLATARRFQAAFGAANARLTARRDELAEGDLDPDWERYGEASNMSRTQDLLPFGESLAYIVMRQHADLQLERCARELAEARCAALAAQPDEARRRLERASKLVERIPETPATAARVRALRQRLAESLKS